MLGGNSSKILGIAIPAQHPISRRAMILQSGVIRRAQSPFKVCHGTDWHARSAVVSIP